MEKRLEVRNLSKSFGRKGYETPVLKNIQMDVYERDFIAIMGPSGAGKTTLLNLLSTLDTPSGGEIFLDGQEITKMKNKELSILRRDKIGFIFQDYNLLDNMTLQDNIALPLSLNGKKSSQIINLVQQMAESFGLEKHLQKYPYQLSGGQKQRAASARALITKPKILFADEPTGSVQLVHYYPKKILVISPSLLISIFLIIDLQNVLFSSLDNPSYISLNPFCIMCSTREKSGAFSCCSSGMLARAEE